MIVRDMESDDLGSLVILILLGLFVYIVGVFVGAWFIVEGLKMLGYYVDYWGIIYLMLGISIFLALVSGKKGGD